MVQVQLFETGTRYGLEILHQCVKMVKTKRQKVLEANTYFCKLQGENGGFFAPILNRVKNFAKFTGKHLCQNLFFNKLWHRLFPINSEKFLRTPIFIEHLRWLLLRKEKQMSKTTMIWQLAFFY